MVNTEMLKGHESPLKIEVEECVGHLFERIDKDVTMETTGSLWHFKGEILPW